MKYYCSKCFAKIEYKFSKPEKCPFCGFLHSSARINSEIDKPYVETKPNPPVTAKKDASKNSYSADAEDSEDEYFEVDAVPIIRPGAGVKVEIEKPKTGITIGNLIESSYGTKNDADSCFGEFDSFNGKLTQKEMLEQFRKEASNRKEVIEIV